MKCVKCNNEKSDINFYKSYSPLHNGKIPYCKTCIRDFVNVDDIKTVKDTLRMIDRPYLQFLWERSIDESKETNKEIFGMYMKNLGMKQYRELTWNDSDSSHGETSNEDADNTSKNTLPEIPQNELDTLKEKYGFGYPDDEYLLFEKKYKQLRPSFQLLTTMHEEYFKEYCINKVKETLAKSRGDFKEAKEWAAMVKDVAEAGKLKPSQMSKADLSQGLDGFGQLARMVEEKVELQKVLPKFTERPKDNVDITLWLYINYVRDLKGMPEAEYKEIWKFYEERYKDYTNQSLDYGSDEG